METGELSSNWKVLQKKLQTDQPSPAKGSADSRKRKLSTSQTERVKRAKTKVKHLSTLDRRNGKMGLSLSSEKPTTANSTTSSTIAKPNTSGTSSRTSLADSTSKPAIDSSASLALTEPPNLGFYPAADEKARYVALDCEMVGTGPPPHSDSQLARVSLTNYHGALLYDSFVLPVIPVTDHRTRFSGVRESDLRPGYARPFREVQADVAGLIEGRTLVGHALRNDLAVLMLSHPRRDLRDTARHPPYRQLASGRTPALRRLAKEKLGVDVQQGEHSSVEDARVSMLLYRHQKEEFEKEAVKRYGSRKVDGGKGKTRKTTSRMSGANDEDLSNDEGSGIEGQDQDGSHKRGPKKNKKKRRKGKRK